MGIGSFNNPITGGGGALLINQIKSPNFQHGVSGWMIGKDGSAEFNDLEIRGTFFGVDFIVNSVGLFFYSGAPSLGNLIMSFVPGTASVLDPEGNTAPPGITVGTASSTQLQLVSSGGIGQLLMRLNSASFSNGVLESAITGSFAQMILNGPKSTVAGFTDLVGIILNSSDGVSSSANMDLVYTDKNGTAHEYAFMDDTGFHIQAGAVTAVDPSTGTGLSNPAQPETWHAQALPSGWGGGIAIKLYPDATVGLAGLVTLPASGAYNNVNLFSMPAAYRPAGGAKRLAIASLAQSAAYGNNGASPGLPRIFIDTSGNVSFAGIPAAVNGSQVCVDGVRYPIDI